MFDSKNAAGWALALVALGLFIGLVTRDLVRKDNPPEGVPAMAAMLPPQEEHPRKLDDLTERFEHVTTQCLPYIVTLQASASPNSAHASPSFSGVLMSPEGYILTHAGLVREARQLVVTLRNKKTFVGEIVGRDLLTELAVVKISASGLKGIRQGNSDDVRPGQWVMALGGTAIDRPVVFAGIVSMKGRGNVWLAEEEDFMQTDAVITAQNAGGALVDLQGRLVAINFMREATAGSHAGIHFAVPVNMAREVMRRIIAEGKFGRGALPLRLQDLDAQLAQGLRLPTTGGALISEIEAGANTVSDLQRGDVIIAWSDKKTANSLALRELAASTKPGTNVALTIMRAGAELMRAVTVTEAGANQNADEETLSAATANLFGLMIEPLTPALLRELKLPMNTHGIAVTQVERNSAAELAGIRVGDVMQEWEGKSVTNVKDFRARLAATSGETVLVYLRRGQHGLYCALEIAAPAPNAL